ncbi:hypothetical protein AB0420_37875, partial [Streptomyces caelestis]|uniref:hypothetical protein n=1 Tax=Streptomyces caelestis TaxID=36816 RepID=UPI00344EC1BF
MDGVDALLQVLAVGAGVHLGVALFVALHVRAAPGVVGAAADMHVRALDPTAHRARGGQQVHIAAVQTERLADPQTGTGQQHDQEAVPRSQGDGDHVGRRAIVKTCGSAVAQLRVDRSLVSPPIAESSSL